MKRWMLCLLCTITLGLGFAGMAAADPASGVPALNSSDQQFLASLAPPAAPGVPEAQWMATNNCGSNFCTTAQREACQDSCMATTGCWGLLGCNYNDCTSRCTCSKVSCY